MCFTIVAHTKPRVSHSNAIGGENTAVQRYNGTEFKVMSISITQEQASTPATFASGPRCAGTSANRQHTF